MTVDEEPRIPLDLADAPPPSGTGCLECEAVDGWWVHLRRCVECGHVGCCDDSLERHARAHFAATGHRYIRSFEPGEQWYWDYLDDAEVIGIPLPPPEHHPDDQTVPGPADRVPDGWQRILLQRRISEG
ncbi:UBP-type zinc finger domain-containing protein [Microbacterium candidum]|uniref:UBP-type zinc finger domain-containing protein n=1 Tax=Microbacterium candidum TaxID=3041922 RepID=A0ABT7MTY7_9MICO|nr:UBP-type zinc finger domain-containing protein [Microbacterium sp. ASV49]MDL9977912.1 UBP-type zinc finger domain-containing protein [Microbacterium sp. ASV49]